MCARCLQEVDAQKLLSKTQMEATQAALKTSMQDARTSGFKVDWKVARHETFVTIEGDADLTEKYKVSQLLGSVPLIFAKSELLEKVFAYTEGVVPDDRLLTWITKWENYFESSDSAKKTGTAKCPAYGKHKVEQLEPFIKHIFQETQVFDNTNPKLQECCASPWLFGHTSTFVQCGIEPMGFGTLRVLTLGTIEVLCISGEDCAKVAEEFRGQASAFSN